MESTSDDWYMDTPSNIHQNTGNRGSVSTTQHKMKSNNPYYRYSMPALSFELEPLNRERSGSEPSVSLPDSREHHPPEPRERRESTNPFLRRRNKGYRHSCMVYPDVIDRLDTVGDYQYHHEGPYDAVYPERNRVSVHSPLEAVRESNEEALKATPLDKVVDSVERHRPLDGTAHFASGAEDRGGNTYEYVEGQNMTMNDYGNFVRFPGLVCIFTSNFTSSY